MNINRNCQNEHAGGVAGHRRGPSSFGVLDPERVFAALQLQPGMTLLDLGCGAGDYALRAAALVGKTGMVIALDRMLEAIESLRQRALEAEVTNLKTEVGDITNPLPVADSATDVCLIATVLHMMRMSSNYQSIFKEVRRVLKPEGRLAIIECHKKETGFGPPLEYRVASEELEATLSPLGFEKVGLVDLGYMYLAQFRVKTGELQNMGD
jgi:ubiquinone/menaquinone biosynthesis C-methylase UbiE